MAWERTAISAMVVAVLLVRAGTQAEAWLFAVGGLLATAASGSLLLWAGRHYVELHGPVTTGVGVVHPRATRFVGVLTIAMTGTAAALALWLALGD